MTDTPFTHKILNKDTIIIGAGKQLDNNNAHEMVETITDAQSKGYKFIVLDMKQLEFISSAGVGSILGTIALPLGVWYFEYGSSLLFISIIISIVIIIRHKKNIKRLIERKENKFYFKKR